MENPQSPDSDRLLQVLGISASAERAYVELLESGSPVHHVDAIELESAGLLYRSNGVDVPASIDSVLAVWANARAAEETATRAAAANLQGMFERWAERASAPSVVRLLRGREEVINASMVLADQAETTFEELVRAPFLNGPEGGIPNEQPNAIARGVRYSVVYESSLLRRPGVIDTVHESVALGEIARVGTDLPLRLLIADRRRALVVLPHPSSPERPLIADDADGLIVEESSMLDALIRLFDQVWEHSAPLSKASAESDRTDEPHMPLLSLLSAGMTDAAIARMLGVSERTIHRRVTALAAQYGVTSRFQLGAALAMRGLLTRMIGNDDPPSPVS